MDDKQKYRRDYYDKNREYYKQYRENTKAKRQEIYICDCGAYITNASIYLHNKSMKHQNYLNRNLVNTLNTDVAALRGRIHELEKNEKSDEDV